MKNYKNMIDFGGSIYYLDIEKYTEIIQMETTGDDKIYEQVIKTFKDEKGEIISSEELSTCRERDIFINTNKYELLRLMIDVVMDDMDEEDDSLGSERALSKAGLSYKIAFNTLLHYGVLVEVEE